jgi:hypothetical protein
MWHKSAVPTARTVVLYFVIFRIRISRDALVRFQSQTENRGSADRSCHEYLLIVHATHSDADIFMPRASSNEPQVVGLGTVDRRLMNPPAAQLLCGSLLCPRFESVYLHRDALVRFSRQKENHGSADRPHHEYLLIVRAPPMHVHSDAHICMPLTSSKNHQVP